MKSFNEKISVIIPVYNTETYLNSCIESVIHQTYNNLEIIIVDDGSTDNSFDVCKSFEQKDLRVKVIHKNNGGPSSARNVGLNNMSGKYFMFVDSDDILHRDAIEKLYSYIIKHNADIVISVVRTIINNKIVEYNHPISGVYTNIDILNFAFLKPKHGYWGPYAKLIKTDLINHHVRFDENIFACEDLVFLAEYLFYAKKIFFSNENVYDHFKRENSLSTTYNLNKRRKTQLIAFNKLIKIIDKYNDENLSTNYIYQFYDNIYYLMRKAYISGDIEFYEKIKNELKDKYVIWKSKSNIRQIIQHRIIELLMDISISPKVLELLIYGLKNKSNFLNDDIIGHC